MNKLKKIGSSEILLILIGLLLLYPFSLLFQAFFDSSESEVWEHLKSTVLGEYIWNSVSLIVLVSLISLILGLLPAWYLANYKFRGSKFLEWGLILPLTIPSYIMAYAYVGLFDLTGLIHSILTSLGIKDEFHMDVLYFPVLALILSFSLFPYLYIITKAYFENQSHRYVEAAQTLGLNASQRFRRVVLPLARPAIVGGLSLIVMELLNDYGAVKYFGVPTFTTGIFKVWFSFGDHESALKLSTYLLLIAFLMIAIERWSRRKMRFVSSKVQSIPFEKNVLNAKQKKYVPLIVWIPFILCFAIPVFQLIYWATQALDYLNLEFFSLIFDSLWLAILSAFVILTLSVLINYIARSSKLLWIKKVTHVLTLGYAIPGAIIAVCVFLPFTEWSKDINHLLGTRWGLFLNNLFITMIFAYLLRFFAVGYNAVDANLQKLNMSLDESAKVMGLKRWQILWRLILPNIKPALLASLLMLFIDMLKELPLTLILRPFDFDTLATKTFELANDEMLEEASLPALIIIILGVGISYILNKFLKK